MAEINNDLKHNAALFGEVIQEAIKLQTQDLSKEKILAALKAKFDPKLLRPLLTGEVKISDAVKAYLGANGMRTIVEDHTGIMKHREWRGVRDTAYDYSKWLELWGLLGKWLLKHPVTNVSALLRYRWMAVYLTAPAFFDRGVWGFRDTALRAARNNLNTITRGLTAELELLFAADQHLHPGNELSKKCVMMDVYTPRLFMEGFENLHAIPTQLIPHYLPGIIDQHFNEHYIDVTESYGVTPDVCALPSVESGIAIEDDFPITGCCYVSTNMPCDGSIMSSTIMDRRFNLPTYVLNVPLRHTRDDVQEYAVEELLDCIHWIEEQTGEKYNYDRLREACERWNEQNALRLEKWDLNMTDQPPHYGATNWMYRIYTYHAMAGDPVAIKNDRKVNKILRKSMEKPRRFPAVTRHRAVLWNTIANMYPDFDEWALSCWGIETVFQFIEDQGHRPIDTSTNETMLAGVAKSIQEATMRVHSKGGYNAYGDDLWTFVEQYNADMIIMFDQISCKGPGAINGLMEEEARKRGIRMVWVKHDLVDPRTISRRDMRDQLNKYMDTVMNEKPLDPSLVDFDDSRSW